MFNNMNTVTQGSVGLANAISYYTLKGYIVSLPLIDNQEYDLLVDCGNGIEKVQVKTTKRKVAGNFKVQIKTVRPNRKSNTIKRFDNASVDLLFVLTEDMESYSIPCKEINVGCELTLDKRYEQYKFKI